MKKGISLIVLVITIIIMIILAGAVILSLNSSNVVAKANYAAVASDRANYQAEAATEYATWVADNNGDLTGDFEYSKLDLEAPGSGTGFYVDYDDASQAPTVYYKLNGASLDGMPAGATPSWVQN